MRALVESAVRHALAVARAMHPGDTVRRGAVTMRGDVLAVAALVRVSSPIEFIAIPMSITVGP